MRKAIRIGRLFGIQLQLDSSWLFVFALVVWSLTSVFQAWHPVWTSGTALAAAVVTGIAFFASVVFHELAHALVARIYKLPVRDITLHMFGGISNIEREPPTPGAELLIAAVGPIASVALGIAMLVVAAFVTGISFLPGAGAPGPDAMAELGPAATLLVWLGPVNIAVGLFNLVPGFPLDGGRILRAVLWKSTGNLHTATRWSTSVGQAVGIGFILVGAAMSMGLRVPFFGTGFGSGLWLALIGMFLRGAAKQHQAGSDVAEALEGVRVATLMRTNNVTVPANASIRTLVEQWFDRRTDAAMPVYFRDRFVGVVSAEDAAKVPAEEWEEHTAREIMIPATSVPSTAPSDAAFDALRTMEAAETTALPVIDDGELVGMLFERDIERWLAMQTPMLRTRGDRPRPA
jgi:Zn-dependent protease/predicted transcriptional regulator